MIVTVKLALAAICFSGQCYPALVGEATPPGHYVLSHLYVAEPGYGGDVLNYRVAPDGLYAIHRVWTRLPAERRAERLKAADPAQRRAITGGCINVMPDVYARLVDCCSGAQLEIEP